MRTYMLTHPLPARDALTRDALALPRTGSERVGHLGHGGRGRGGQGERCLQQEQKGVMSCHVICDW